MTDAADILLFSYGTLQLESVQRASFGRRLNGEPDAMTGYVRTMVEITDPDGIEAYRLMLDQNEQFQMVPRV